MSIEDTNDSAIPAGDQPNAADNPAPETTEGDAPAETEEAKAAREQTEREEAARQETKKKNRTTAYIERMKAENQAARQKLAELEAKLTQPAQPAASEPVEGEPRLAEFNYDFEAYQRAHTRWGIAQADKVREDSRRQADLSRQQQELGQTYQSRVDTFTEDHPDFVEKVMSLPPLPWEIQAAIMGHEKGPELAYHLAQNRKELLDLSRTPANLLGDAVTDLASRLKPAPQAAPQTPVRVVSSAPAPTPTVSGRTAGETPPEKLTDEQWLERQKEADRQRRRR